MVDEIDFSPAESPKSFEQIYSHYLSLLKEKNTYRILPTPHNAGNQTVLDFSTNDYLNLSTNKALLQAAYACGSSGSTGSRLLSGNSPIFERFEERIAQDKKCEAALIFSSGFQANSSALATLCDKKVLKDQAILFFDKYVHSSLYQAAFLAGAHLVRFKHNDMGDLGKLLAQYGRDPRKKYIVTETVFGMDGDISPLPELADLAKKYGALLYLDEAHATGVFGHQGYGLSTQIDLSLVPHVIMGTFSKALGAFGAYIATSSIIKDYLVNTCPGFIFSTALPPMVIAAALHAWEMLPRLDKERQMLLQHASLLRTQLQELGFNTGSSCTHIIPIILGNEKRTLSAKKSLAKKNIIVSAIRPPTVAPGTSRLRIALSTKHTQEDIETLIDAVKKV